MKRTFLFLAALLLLFGASFTYGNTDDKEKIPASEAASAKTILTGKVVDSETSEPLTGVALEIINTQTVIYTDFDGGFIINNLTPGYYTIVVRYISYQDHLIENIYLEQGTNILSLIKLPIKKF